MANGVFSGNYGSGLSIQSLGTVSISKVTAEDNYSNQGVYINNSLGTAGVNITGMAVGGNQFNSNGSHGLEVISKGNILVNSLVATDNVGNGVFLDNSNGTGSVNVARSSLMKTSEVQAWLLTQKTL